MDSSTPTRRDRDRRDELEFAEGSDSRVFGEFDSSKRFVFINPFRLHSLAEQRDYASLDSPVRQNATARTRPFALSTQILSFEVVRLPSSISLPGLTRNGPASFVTPRPLRSSQPNLQIQPRPQPHAPLDHVAAESIGRVLVQTVTQLPDQVAAQSAAHITAFSLLLRRFDDLRAAILPMLSRPPLPPSALSTPAPIS